MILSILKIIGIIFLVILALLIFILGIILFVPIRYKFVGEHMERPNADVQIRWSPILLNATLNYRDSNLVYVVRMLGGVVMTNQDIPLSWIGRRFFSSNEEDESDIDVKKEFVVIEDEIEFEGPQSNVEDVKIHKRTEVVKAIEKTNSRKSKPSLMKRFRQRIRDIQFKFRRFIDKVKKLNTKREALLKVYHHKRFELAKKDFFAYIKTLWNIIRPKHLEGYIHFGMEDPATTGQALGVMAMFLVWYNEFLRIEPNFEQACFDGYLKGNGKVRLFSIGKLAIKILLNKNLIKVIKKVQTIIEA